MSLQHPILDEMKRKKVTAQAPISADLIWSMIPFGLNIQSIENELQRMYTCHPRLVNRMQHTKNGMTQMVYWPTGMHQAISYSDPAKKIAPTPVRREITSQKQKEDSMMNKLDSQSPAELSLLSYIWLNPNCSLSQAERECNVNVNCAKGYLSWYFTQGYLLRTAYKKINQISYSIKAAGMTASQLFELKQNQKVLDYVINKKPSPFFSILNNDQPAPIETQPQNDLDIPTFLTSSNKDVVNDAALAPIQSETIKEPDYGDFKVAYSSNGTLMLFGLQYGLIELNHEQLETLYDFMNTSVNIQ